MPYTDVLKLLLERIEGAIGVGFVAQDGETVQLEGHLEDYAHRIHLAYQGILLQILNRIHKSPKVTLRLVLSVHQDCTVVVKPLMSGYFLVLTLKHRKNLHRAVYQLEEAAEALNQEL